MKVSVIIPTYNRSEVLPRAIESVLAQTYENIELIIVDDCSTDNTPSVVSSYDDSRIQFYRHSENINASAARNTGIQYASGDYIAFLDSDDEWKPDKLKSQLEELESRDQNWVAVYCATDIQRTGTLDGLWEKVSSKRSLKEGGAELIKDVLKMRLPVYAGSTLLANSEIVQDLSGFDSNFERHQDYEFLIRLLQKGKLAYVPDQLVNIYPGSSANADVTRNAKKVYFDKFSKQIRQLETSGYDIKSPHFCQLARLYFNEGKFRKGWYHLKRCNSIGSQQYISLVWAVYRGICGRTKSLCN